MLRCIKVCSVGFQHLPAKRCIRCEKAGLLLQLHGTGSCDVAVRAAD